MSGGTDIATGVEAHREEMVALRRDLHHHPELAYSERRTSDLVAQSLSAWGYQVSRGLGGTGVVGTLVLGDGPRRIGIRADMDALPIVEATGLPYASGTSGVMHACGHDGHTASLLTAARVLAERRDFSGTLNLIFQPAEEGGAGARRMIEDGLFERFPCDAVFGLHNWPGVPTGQFGFVTGPAMAAADRVVIRVVGKGGHGAAPHQTVDPVVAGALLVMALQSVVSRNVDPLDAAVITVGSIHGGLAANVIPDSSSCRSRSAPSSRRCATGSRPASPPWPGPRPKAMAPWPRSTTGAAIRCWSTMLMRPSSRAGSPPNSSARSGSRPDSRRSPPARISPTCCRRSRAATSSSATATAPPCTARATLQRRDPARRRPLLGGAGGAVSGGVARSVQLVRVASPAWRERSGVRRTTG
jgi:hypothetical protein